MRLVASSAWAMPKSMTFGPPEVRSTLEGLRSRCTIPAAWIAASASASPVARPYSIPASSGPWVSMYSDKRGAVGVLGDQERLRRLGIGRDHPYRAHALDAGQHGDLTAEPDPEFRVVGQFGAQHLDRDLLAIRVHAEIHDAHPACTQPGEEAITSDLRRVRLPQRRASQPIPLPLG